MQTHYVVHEGWHANGRGLELHTKYDAERKMKYTRNGASIIVFRDESRIVTVEKCAMVPESILFRIESVE